MERHSIDRKNISNVFLFLSFIFKICRMWANRIDMRPNCMHTHTVTNSCQSHLQIAACPPPFPQSETRITVYSWVSTFSSSSWRRLPKPGHFNQDQVYIRSRLEFVTQIVHGIAELKLSHQTRTGFCTVNLYRDRRFLAFIPL